MKEKLRDTLFQIIPENKRVLFQRISEQRTKKITVLLENIFQEHNASAVLRNCDCFGIQELHVIEDSNKYKVQRDIARGAGKWVDLISFNDTENANLQAVKNLKEKGFKIATLSPEADQYDIYNLPIDQPIALVFGTEWKGVSEDIKVNSDYKVKIPMVGFTESFNVSVSVALTLQALRNRLENSSSNWKLSYEEQLDLQIKWCEKYIKNGKIVRQDLEKRILNNEI
jgi:tRNA (guanosine-2'-O-)-methyltransferase